MPRNVVLKLPVPFGHRALLRRGILPEKQVEQMARGPSPDGHGLDAGHAVHHNIRAGHAVRPPLHGGVYLLLAVRGVKAVAAADGLRPVRRRLDHLNIHFPEQAPHGPVHRRPPPHRAGVVHAHLQPVIVLEGEISRAVEELPQRDRGDPLVIPAKAPVAPRADVYYHRARRELRVMAATYLMQPYLRPRQVPPQEIQHLPGLFGPVNRQRAAGIEVHYLPFGSFLPPSRLVRPDFYFPVRGSGTVRQTHEFPSGLNMC